MNQHPQEAFASRQWTFITSGVSNTLSLYEIIKFLVLHVFIGDGAKKRTMNKQKMPQKLGLWVYTLQGRMLGLFIISVSVFTPAQYWALKLAQTYFIVFHQGVARFAVKDKPGNILVFVGHSVPAAII